MRLAITLLALAIAGPACSDTRYVPEEFDLGCNLEAAAVETDGIRRLALLVGVGEYEDPKISDLKGPPVDVRSMYALLTGEDGYGFPPSNVCVLLDRDATKAGVVTAFERSLTKRAQDGDIAVFYYTGHGSRVSDMSGDEPDGWDETFMVQDSRKNRPENQLTDDEFNSLLSELHAKTPNVTVLLDSCHSGTATRGASSPEDGGPVPRYVEPTVTRVATPETRGDGDGERIQPNSLPGMVVLSAARSGTVAYDSIAGGRFTESLVNLLSDAPPNGQTWEQVATRLQPTMFDPSYPQAPWFEGALDRVAFGVSDRKRPRAFRVIATSPLLLRGVPAPGVGVGSEMRVYSDSAQGSDLADPAKAKGKLILGERQGLDVTASIIGSRSFEPELGDIAVLAVASTDSTRLPLRVRNQGPRALSAERVAEVKAALNKAEELPQRVELVDSAAAFQLEQAPDGTLQLRGPEGIVRNTFAGAASFQLLKAVENIGHHASQLAIMALEGDGGASFQNGATLTARVIRRGGAACNAKGFVQACPNEEQKIPVCTKWEIEVTNNSEVDLLVGGGVLWNSGAISGVPKHGERFLLPAGATATMPGAKFRSTPPLDAIEHIALFGTRIEHPVDWSKLTVRSSTKDDELLSPLARLFERIIAGERGGEDDDEIENPTTWTSTKIPIRAVANAHMIDYSERELRCHTEGSKEYTVNDFDIRPYLPASPENPLRLVLEEAHALAVRGQGDGIPYKQHAWIEGSDDANLLKGIDCSRSIWWAFTRAGLTYNSKDEYLWTGLMFSDDTPMKEEFTECSSDSLQTGDVLVYFGTNSKGTPSGHTVMVIDPEQRIAWGSHGWDGNPNLPGGMESDTGVEYQHIRNRPHWENWDSSRMTLRACWRHKSFARPEIATRGSLTDLECTNTCSVVMP